MNIVGVMRVKNEARWIKRSIESQHFCDKIIVLDNHSDDDTRDICRQFSNVTVIESPFSDFNEGRDREFLAQKAKSLGAEWIVSLDGDEVFEWKTWVKIQESLNNPDINVIDFLSLNLWGSDDIVRVDRNYGCGYRGRIWRVPEGTLTYQPMHCALPDQTIHRVSWPNTFLYHYGFIDQRLRQMKFERYMVVDPHSSTNLTNYKSMVEESVHTESVRDFLRSKGLWQLA